MTYIKLWLHSFDTVANEDYVTISNALFSFGPCDTISCLTVDLLDDCILEEREELHLILSETPGLDSRVKLRAGTSLIEITDNDRKIMLYTYVSE